MRGLQIMSRIITLDELKGRIINHFGDSIIISNFTKLSEVADFECKKCGYTWSTIASEVGRGRGCKNCYIIRKTISREEVENRIFKIHGKSIKLIKYTAIKEYATFECDQGHQWSTVTSSVANVGTGCPECEKINRVSPRKLSFEKVKEYIESFNCVLLSNDYLSNSKKLLIKFECGHIQNLSYADFQKGVRCHVCAKKKMAEKFKRPPEEIFEFLNENNLKFVEFVGEYKNGANYIIFECEKGHKTKRRVAEIFVVSECLECSKARRRKFYRGKNNHSWKGGLTPLRKYLQNEIKEWKQLSLKASNYTCTITNEKSRDLDVHHLVTFSKILLESIDEINLQLKDTIGEYSQDELNELILKVQEIHYRYPLGAPVKRAYHHRFHGLYGTDGKTTPEQWYEFVDRVHSGEIVI
jgi:hypothetical protein